MTDEKPNTLQIKLRNPDDGEVTTFKVKKTTSMNKIFSAFAKKYGYDLPSLRFIFDGERVQASDTPKTLEMDNDDQIDCFIEAIGGCE
jgi:hypothetical protein